MPKEINLYIILSFFIFSCNIQPDESIGENNEITILCSEKDRIYSEHIIEHFFNSRFLNTPQREHVYKINWANSEKLSNSKIKKNLLILSLVYPQDSTIDILYQNISQKNNIDTKIVSLSDFFAKNQKVVLIRSLDTIELQKELEINIEWIFSEYNENIYNNYDNYMNKYDKNIKLQSLLRNNFNISIFIKEDYELINQQEDFLWIGRGYPYRWIIFAKLDKTHNRSNPYLLFSDIINQYNVDIEISDYYKKKTNLLIDKNKINVYRGLYNHPESDSGGPFALYILDNKYNDEVILVASIINNPGNNKMDFLLQADALINKIKFYGEYNE